MMCTGVVTDDLSQTRHKYCQACSTLNKTWHTAFHCLRFKLRWTLSWHHLATHLAGRPGAWQYTTCRAEMSAFCLCYKHSSVSLRGRSSSLLGTSWTALPWQTTATLLFRHLSGVFSRSGCFLLTFQSSLSRPLFGALFRPENFILAFQWLLCCPPNTHGCNSGTYDLLGHMYSHSVSSSA